ncbi:MAG: hypothetical protein MUE85_09670 [Microscillaceae bacterium]|jgi:putative NADH-flavin reductase|nr:hypothetical protein [Microscillaceae bacterium]
MAKNTDKKKEKAKKINKSVKVSEKLGDFDIVIDSFGKIQSNYDVDKINEFLNQNVDDKKLKNRSEGSEDMPEE